MSGQEPRDQIDDLDSIAPLEQINLKELQIPSSDTSNEITYKPIAKTEENFIDDLVAKRKDGIEYVSVEVVSDTIYTATDETVEISLEADIAAASIWFLTAFDKDLTLEDKSSSESTSDEHIIYQNFDFVGNQPGKYLIIFTNVRPEGLLKASKRILVQVVVVE